MAEPIDMPEGLRGGIDKEIQFEEIKSYYKTRIEEAAQDGDSLMLRAIPIELESLIHELQELVDLAKESQEQGEAKQNNG